VFVAITTAELFLDFLIFLFFWIFILYFFLVILQEKIFLVNMVILYNRMNRKEDYIQILEFGKDVTENMKWKGNSKITTFFQKLYSQTNFDNAIKIINKKDETSRNIIGAIQKIEGLIISGKYKTIIQFLINQLNNKNLRDSDVLKALENRLKREPTESNNLKPFKFKGGKSKKNKKRGMKKTRKNIKRGGFPSFLSSLNPFNILRSRSAVVPTDTDEIDLDLESFI
jgi:hypothetical protein